MGAFNALIIAACSFDFKILILKKKKNEIDRLEGFKNVQWYMNMHTYIFYCFYFSLL